MIEALSTFGRYYCCLLTMDENSQSQPFATDQIETGYAILGLRSPFPKVLLDLRLYHPFGLRRKNQLVEGQV